jgi:hypothetical protein
MNEVLLEVPLNAGAQNIIDYSYNGCNVVAYDSYGYSPLNGGRNNHSLSKSDELLRVRFFEDVSKLNQSDVPFYLVYTNFFCDGSELNSREIFEPLDFLADGIDGNGVVINNPELEKYIRNRYGDTLKYVASCQRVFFTPKMLSLEQRVSHYIEDLNKFDYVVLAPHDSEDLDAIEMVPQELREKLVSIINTPCQSYCNSYWHYVCTSLLNKRDSFHQGSFKEMYREELERIKPGFNECISLCSIDNSKPILQKEMIREMVDAGVNTFKIGRGRFDNDIADMMEFYLNLYGVTF